MSEDANVDAGTEVTETDTADVVTPPESNGWWQFQSKEEAAEWANTIVEKRLARERKKYEPVLQERDTLKAEIEELRPLKEATLTDSQRWESERAALTSELEELRNFRKDAERSNLIRDIAEEKGLPAKLVKWVSGDDADAITQSVEELLNDLSEVGKPTKPASQRPRETGSQPATQGVSGGGSDADEDSTVTARIIKKYRESRNTFSL